MSVALIARALVAAAVAATGVVGTVAITGDEPRLLNPGDSWQAAYAAAQPGEEIIVRGAHPAQTLSFAASKSGEGDEPDVTFRVEPGATVAGLALYGARHITFEGLDVTGITTVGCKDTGVPVEARGQHAVDVTFSRSHLRQFVFRNPQRLFVVDSDLGPSGFAPIIGGSGDTGGGDCTDEVPDVTFERNLFHDMVEVSAASHMECLLVEGGNLVVRDNVFRNCSVFDVFLKGQLSAGKFGFPRVLIEGNRLERPVASPFRPAGTRALSLSAGNYGSVTIRDNDLPDATLELRTDLPTTWQDVLVEGNRAARRGGSCSTPGIRWVGNVYTEPGQNCPGEEPAPPPPPPPPPTTTEPPPPTTTEAPPPTTVPPPPALVAPELSLTTFSQRTVTLTWAPVDRAEGYRFYHDGVLVSSTNDPARASVKFGVTWGRHTLAVEAFAESDQARDELVAEGRWTEVDE